MELFEFLSALEPRRALAGTLVLSIVAYALAANIGWATRVPLGGRVDQLSMWWRTSRLIRVVSLLARWVYYLIVPYGTLILGYTTVRALGVANLEWMQNWQTAALIAIGSIFVLIWIWRPYAREEHPKSLELGGWNWARRVIEIIYQQAHWAFYRSGPILWLDDFYWGSFIGLLLVLLEGWTSPVARVNVRDIIRADSPLWTGCLAIISTILFIFTQNTWYCLGLHLVFDFGLRPLIGFSRSRVGSESPNEM